jgi:hypothetical protein
MEFCIKLVQQLVKCRNRGRLQVEPRAFWPSGTANEALLGDAIKFG